LKSLENRSLTFQESIQQVNMKLEEKWNTLSLDLAKQELQKYYNNFKKLLLAAK